MITRILLVLTGAKEGEIAINHAIHLAKMHRATIHAVGLCSESRAYVAEPVPVGGMAFAADAAKKRAHQMRERIERMVHTFEGSAAQSQVGYEVAIEQREPIDALADHWRFCDLVVCPRRSLFDQGMKTESDGMLNKLVSLGIRPILSVDAEVPSVDRALVALSGSTVSAKVFKRFCQLLPWNRIPIDLVHIGESSPEAQDLLKRSAEFARGHGLEVGQSAIRQGRPLEGIEGALEDWGCDAVVLGDSCRTLLARKMLGDVALDMVKRCRKPLFLSH